MTHYKVYHDYTYLQALHEILAKGIKKGDRTGTGTISYFGMQMRFPLQERFPLLTTKKVHWPSIIWELLWFLRGDTNVNWLRERGVTIWDNWARPDGSLGPIYGAQWRTWGAYNDGTFGIDQLSNVVHTLKSYPNDRRMIVSAWNVSELGSMELPPCHLLFQFWVGHGELSCQIYQRSCDMFLGVPFNIASYAALVHIICHITGLKPGELIWTGGDCHIYRNHLEQVNTQLERRPFESPRVEISKDAPDNLDGGWDLAHFILEHYEHHPGIKAPVAV